MDQLNGKRTRWGTLVLILAVSIAVVSVTLFHVPFATVGLLLVCPLLMAGMHGLGHDRNDGMSSGQSRSHS